MSAPYREIKTINDALSKNAKESAVLILHYEKNNEVFLALIQRTIYEGKHSGQISFPGGKKELNDKSLKETALRETFEEIGIEPKNIEILAELTHLHIPVSNFLVYPFVGELNCSPTFIKQEKEVEQIIEVKLSDILNTKNIIEKEILWKEKNITFKTPAYKVNGIEIWGATAMILSEYLEIINN